MKLFRIKMEIMDHCTENLSYSNYYELSPERFMEVGLIQILTDNSEI